MRDTKSDRRSALIAPPRQADPPDDLCVTLLCTAAILAGGILVAAALGVFGVIR